MGVIFLPRDVLAKETDGIVLIDVHLQGFWEHENFIAKFPETYAWYQQICRNAYKGRVGSTILTEEGRNKIGLMVTKQHRKTPKDNVITNFRNCVNDLFNKVPSDVFLYSPILGRHDYCGVEVHKMLENLVIAEEKLSGEAARKWFICRENKR